MSKNLHGLDVLIKVTEAQDGQQLQIHLNDRTDRGLHLTDIPTVKQTFSFGDVSDYAGHM